MDGSYSRHRNENLVRRVPLYKLLKSGKVKINTGLKDQFAVNELINN